MIRFLARHSLPEPIETVVLWIATVIVLAGITTEDNRIAVFGVLLGFSVLGTSLARLVE